MKTEWIRGVVAVVLLSSALSATSGTPTSAQLADVHAIVEAEYWRVGNPSEERLLELYCRAVKGGSPEVRIAIDEAMRDLAKRHWVNPAVFADCLDEADGLALGSRRPASATFSDATRPMRTLIALAELPRDQRLELYKGVIGAGKPLFGALDGRIEALGWLSTMELALREEMDELVPLIQRALEEHQTIGDPAPRVVEALQCEYLVLAHAREGDWVNNYMELVRENVESQTRPPMAPGDEDRNLRRDMARSSRRNRLVREALLRLVHEGRAEVLPELRQLWHRLQPRPGDETEWRRLTQLRDRGLLSVDTEVPRVGPVADYLQQAIRALGEPSFQMKNWEYLHGGSPADLEEALVRKGLLARKGSDRE